MDLATGYWPAAALIAAVDLGVFERLASRSRTAEELATDMGASPRMLADLLRALAGLGLLTKKGDRYSIARVFAPFLRSDGERCLLDALRFNRDLYAVWGRLSDALRRGESVIPPGAHLGGDPERTRRFILGMHSRAMGLAEAILPAVRVPPKGTLLDLGSGPGTFTRLLAEQRKGLRVIQFDLPPVLEVARELARRSPAADRIEYYAGDYRRDSLPSDVDAILFCGALHQETEASAADLFRRARAAMRPDGVLTVIDLMLDSDGVQPVFAALFSLNMKLFNPAAGVFETSRVSVLLKRAGFYKIITRPLPHLPYRAVSGICPAAGKLMARPTPRG